MFTGNEGTPAPIDRRTGREKSEVRVNTVDMLVGPRNGVDRAEVY